MLAFLSEPEPPKGLRDLWDKFRCGSRCSTWRPRRWPRAPCQEVVLEGTTSTWRGCRCRPAGREDAGPAHHLGSDRHARPSQAAPEPRHLPPAGGRPNQVIMRWLAHRGGALDFRDHGSASREPFPVAVALGADPATMLAAVTPIPTRCRNTSSPGCCAARAPSWSSASATIFVSRRARKSSSKATSSRRRRRSKARTAITPATTTRVERFPVLHSSASRCGATRSTTPPTPASRPTSRRCSASR